MNLDRELFDLPKRTGRTKAETAIRVLIAAGFHPGFGSSLDDMYDTWGPELEEFDPDVVGEATRVWRDTLQEFPTLPRFVETCQGIVTTRERAVHPSTTCPTCGGSRYIDCAPGEGGRVNASSPCPDCNPVQYSWVRDGHSSWRHTRVNCSHPLCIHMSGRDRAKAKKR